MRENVSRNHEAYRSYCYQGLVCQAPSEAQGKTLSYPGLPDVLATVSNLSVGSRLRIGGPCKLILHLIGMRKSIGIFYCYPRAYLYRVTGCWDKVLSYVRVAWRYMKQIHVLL